MIACVCVVLCLLGFTHAQHYSATYLPSNVPNQTEEGQAGTNQCGTGANQTSQCQNAYFNGLDDFCLFAPPEPGPGSVIGNTERIEVSWCLKSGYGTRLIPDGAITGAHFVETPDYIQITGTADLTKLNVPHGDGGGELDPHGADGNGNPIGGLVFSSAFGSLMQLHEWTEYIGSDTFCFRACKEGPRAPKLCQHIYDELGCFWNMPANYDSGVFESCQGDTGEPMGIYGSSTFYQGQPVTPPPHPAPSSSSCSTFSSISNGFVISGTSLASSATTTTTTTSSSTSTAVGSGSRSGSSSNTATGSGGSATASAASSAAHISFAIPGWQNLLCIVSTFIGAAFVFSA